MRDPRWRGDPEDMSVLCCMGVHGDCTYDEIPYRCSCECHGWGYRIRWWFRARFMEEGAW